MPRGRDKTRPLSKEASIKKKREFTLEKGQDCRIFVDNAFYKRFKFDFNSVRTLKCVVRLVLLYSIL